MALALFFIAGGIYLLGLFGKQLASWRGSVVFAVGGTVLLFAPDIIMSAAGAEISSPVARQFANGIEASVALTVAYLMARRLDTRGAPR